MAPSVILSVLTTRSERSHVRDHLTAGFPRPVRGLPVLLHRPKLPHLPAAAGRLGALPRPADRDGGGPGVRRPRTAPPGDLSSLLLARPVESGCGRPGTVHPRAVLAAAG